MKLLVIACLLATSVAVFAHNGVHAPEDFCESSGLAGGWSEIDAKETPAVVDDIMLLAVEEFIAQNGTFACPDTFATELVAACSQVVAGTNYQVLFEASCEDAESTVLKTIAFVPLPPNDDNIEIEVEEMAY